MARGAKRKDTIQANSFQTFFNKAFKNRWFTSLTKKEALQGLNENFYGKTFKKDSNVLKVKQEIFKKFRESITDLKEAEKAIIIARVDAYLKSDKNEDLTPHYFANVLINITEIYTAQQRAAAQKEVDDNAIPLSPTLPDVDSSTFVSRLHNTFKSIYSRVEKSISPTELLQKLQSPTTLGLSLSYAVGISSWFIWRGLAKTTFPVIMGPAALKHVDEIEVARSGQILKFRATGSIFLAKQRGGKDSIIVRGVLSKWEILELLTLWSIFEFGKSRVQEFKNEMFGGFNTASLNPMGDLDFTKIRKLTDITKIEEDLSNKTYMYHNVFPIVTRHFIIPNCYIETFSFEHKLPLRDTLQYSILLRTYEHHDSFSLYQNMEDGKLAGTAYLGLEPNKTSMRGTLEFMTNIIWRFLGASGWWVGDQEWKLGDAKKSGELDTYYNVGFESIASAMIMSISGRL